MKNETRSETANTRRKQVRENFPNQGKSLIMLTTYLKKILPGKKAP